MRPSVRLQNHRLAESPDVTAFVLSGGGSLGAVQAGMLTELIAAGLRPDMIVGVSAGALNGAFLAFDPSRETVERMGSLWARMTTRKALGLSWRSLLGFCGLRDHVASADGLKSLLNEELPYRSFDEAAVPLHLVCADLLTGAEVVISKGDVCAGVLASTAIPGVFPPIAYDGRLLIDGAVTSSTPISVAAAHGATRIIVLPCGFSCAQDSVSKWAVGRAMHALTLMGVNQLRRDYEHYAGSVTMRIAPPLCPLRQSSFDYSHGADLVARGRESTRAWLDAGGLDRSGFPQQIGMHTH